MRLAALVTPAEGAERRPPLVIAHGLFGSARNWGGIAKRLAAGGRRVVAVDMRNHGASPRARTQSYTDMAGDLAEALAEAGGGGPADLLGHSMGGKAAMLLALSDPGPLRRLVVGDIAPVDYGHADRRRETIAALKAVDLGAVARRADADRQLAGRIGDRGLRAFLLQSLEVGAAAGGGARWRLGLDALAASMEGLVGFPAAPFEGGARWGGPTLMLVGGASDYVLPAHRPRLRALFPAARVAVLKDAGHWLHADRPEAFAATVAAFLDAPDAAARAADSGP